MYMSQHIVAVLICADLCCDLCCDYCLARHRFYCNSHERAPVGEGASYK